MSTVETIRDVAAEFPTLRREFDGASLVYLDSAATSQTPLPVIDAMTSYYTHSRASIHRGVYPIAVEATDLFEGARQRIAEWLGPRARDDLHRQRHVGDQPGRVHLGSPKRGPRGSGTGDRDGAPLQPGPVADPLRERDAELAYVPVLDDGQLDLDALDALLGRGPKLLAVAHVSNVLGTINPIE